MSCTDLSGRVALVTGAAQGIGLAIARQLAAAGASVCCCDVQLESSELRGVMPERSIYLQCDVTSQEQVEATIRGAVERLGELQILVNNAGIAVDGLLLRIKPEDWSRVLQVNLTGAFNCARAAAKHLLKAREAGRIVNISSVVGEEGNTGQAAYSASKAGLIGLTKSLAKELAGRGVTVNAVSPGFIETEMTVQHVQGERREKLLAAIPLGRIGAAEDVAAAVRFLCSPAASYITGQVLRVNGGMYM